MRTDGGDVGNDCASGCDAAKTCVDPPNMTQNKKMFFSSLSDRPEKKRKLNKPDGVAVLCGGQWFQTLDEFCRNNGLSSSASVVRQQLFDHTFPPTAKLLVLEQPTMRRVQAENLNGCMNRRC